MKNLFLAAVCLGTLIFLVITGWIAVICNTTELFGYVDNQGHFVIPPRYTSALPFENGKTEVDLLEEDLFNCRGIWHFTIDQQGKIIKRVFKPEDCYHQKLTKPSCINGSDHYPQLYSTVVPEGFLRYGYKSRNGTPITPPIFSEANFFYNNVAWVSPAEKGPHRWGIINKKGKYILEPKCSSASSFSDGLAMCRVKVYFGIFY